MTLMASATMCTAPRAARQPPPERAQQIAMPIAALRAADLVDTWGASRGDGRRHQGIDIMAPRGSAVRAVANGEIVKMETSARGGIALYQRDETGAYVFYYAHLDGYAPEIREGDLVRQGQVLGYVGQTGNATTPHLHLEIRHSSASGYWRGDAFNPYPSLIAGRIVDGGENDAK